MTAELDAPRIARQRTQRIDATTQVPALPIKRLPVWRRAQVAALITVDTAVVFSAALLDAVTFGNGSGLTARALDAALMASAAWVGIAVLSGAYEARILGEGTEEYKRVINAIVRFVAITGLVVGFVRPANGMLLLLSVALGGGGLVAGRIAGRVTLHTIRRRQSLVRRVLVIGSQDSAFGMAARIAAASGSGYRVVGVCASEGVDRRRPTDGADLVGASAGSGSSVPPGSSGSSVAAAGFDLSAVGDRRRNTAPPVVGHISQTVAICQRLDVHVVAVAPSSGTTADALRELAWELEGTDIEMLVAPALVDVAGPRISLSPVAGLPLLHVDKPEFTVVGRVLKSTIDRTLAGLGLLALSPLLLLVALLVKLETPGPVLFRQTRVGQGGEEFTMLKFRSMFVDAESRLDDLQRLNQHAEGPLFKMKNDPRLTRVGTHIRRWSLDELPQLINVLRGDMSLVGPRPPLPREVAAYGAPSVFRRLMVRPGLTGLWQVSGRSDLSWQESLRLDLYYVENWSPALDTLILWRTAGAVLRGSGAY